MSKTVLVALFLGFLGGLATGFIAAPVALAQSQTAVTREVRAQSFILVDPSDRMVGMFAAEPVPNRFRRIAGPSQTVQQVPEMRIVVRDAYRRELWSIDTEAARPASQIPK